MKTIEVAEKKKSASPTHDIVGCCQICARRIRASNGLIAHHGYRRPAGWGEQTASCPGARKAPFETDCSVLQAYVQKAIQSLADFSAHLADREAHLFPIENPAFEFWLINRAHGLLFDTPAPPMQLHPGEYGYDRTRKSALAKDHRERTMREQEIARQQERLDGWCVRELSCEPKRNQRMNAL